MKKTTFFRGCAAALALALVLTLAACGGKKPFEVGKTAEALNQSEAFSEALEELDRVIFVRYLGLDDSKITEGVMYASTGATAEEFAVITFADEAAAQGGEEALKAHVEALIRANTDYRPLDIPKLERAVVERRGNSLLLLVAENYDAVGKILG